MKKWVEEAKAALEEALRIAEQGTVPEQDLYKLASLVYSNRQSTNNESLLKKIDAANDEQVLRDWSYDENSRKQYKFHFVSSYLFCFVIAGKVTEMKYDRIMDQVCNKLDLFTDDFTGE